MVSFAQFLYTFFVYIMLHNIKDINCLATSNTKTEDLRIGFFDRPELACEKMCVRMCRHRQLL